MYYNRFLTFERNTVRLVPLEYEWTDFIYPDLLFWIVSVGRTLPTCSVLEKTAEIVTRALRCEG